MTRPGQIGNGANAVILAGILAAYGNGKRLIVAETVAQPSLRGAESIRL